MIEGLAWYVNAFNYRVRKSASWLASAVIDAAIKRER
jgi:hypothetical protein